MKLDREQVLFEGTANHMLDSKPFENYNIGFTTGNGTANEKQNDNSYELKVRESEADLFSNSMEDKNNLTTSKDDKDEEVKDFVPSEHINHSAPEMESFVDVKNNRTTSKYDKDEEFKDFLPSGHFNHSVPEMQSFTDQVVCLDKSVTQHDLPKEVVCCNETTYVKDICVDEGLISEDKYLVDSQVSEKRVCSSVYPSDEIDFETVDERFDVDVPSAKVLSPSADGRKEDHLTNQDSSVDSLPKDVENNLFPARSSIATGEIEGHGTEKLEIKPSEKIFSLGELLSLSWLDMVRLDHEQAILVSPSQESKAESSHIPNGVPASTPISIANKSDVGLEETVLGIGNHGEEGKPASHALDSTSGESTYTSTSELLYSSKAEITCIANDFDPSPSGAIVRNNGLQNVNAECFNALTSTRREDADIGKIPNSSIGETSFSAAGPVSGLITYSGPIAYSGSVSLRSESSTTSTRSFAFPILQSEWNSSPVRMAKADKRQLRKYRSWRRGILCCKF